MHGDARPLVERVVLQGVDVADELRRRRPGIRLPVRRAEVSHQRDAGAVDTGYRLRGELGHVAEQFVDTAAAGDDPGQTGRARRSDQLSSASSWVAGEFGFRGRRAVGLRVVVSHHPLLSGVDIEMLLRDRVRRYQAMSANAWARRSLPDGVFGIIPGSSTTTLRGRTLTSATTSWATWCSIRSTSS